MKHETVNSIVGVLGLVIATVTAVSQFWPETEKLKVVAERRIDTGRGVEFSGLGVLDPSKMDFSPTVGPVGWKIRLFNDSNQPISIVGYKLSQLSGNGSRVESSSFKDRLVFADTSQNEQSFPFSIAPHESVAKIILLMIPYQNETDNAPSCVKEYSVVRQFEKCLFKKGRDLFGNKVDFIGDYFSEDEGWGAVWSGVPQNGPRFEVSFETASGSFFRTDFSYYSY